jgi:hypothetical protein
MSALTQDQYLFAIVALERLPDLCGLLAFADEPVHVLPCQELAAVTCNLPSGKLRPQRSNLKIHHQVIDRLNSAGATPLPFAFGSVTTLDDIEAFLTHHQQALLDRLQAIEGCVEIGIKLRVSEENIFNFVLAFDEALRRTREALLASGRTPSRDEQIALGQRFESSLQVLRHDKGARLRESLDDLCREVRMADSSQTHELANMLLLVPRERLDELDERIETLAAGLPDELIVSLSPPLAPYSFVDLSL